MMRTNRSSRWVVLLLVCTQGLSGCRQTEPQYGTEAQLALPTGAAQVWAVAPAVDLSGQREVDPILQADLLYQQLQAVRGITAVPVNRTAEVYASLGIVRVQSEEQAALVCEMLGCDGLVVPTVTAYDPYNPPKFGASLQLFRATGPAATVARVDPREMTRRAAPPQDDALPPPGAGKYRQVVGMFDAANGSVRDALFAYAAGRNDPIGPMGAKEYLASMDRYCGFVYHELIARLISDAGREKFAGAGR
jgi:hypothetical protein